MQSKKTAALDMMSFGLLVALAAACGESDTASTGGGTGDASTTSAASTTSGVASTGGSTAGEPATSTPTTTSSGGTTSDGSAASVSSSSGEGTTTEAASSSSTGSSSTGSSGTGGDPPPLTEYCDCMLSKCHDQYHMKFGEDHVAAEMMCLAYAASVPTIGAPAESGASIECYYWACTQSDCTSAFGGGVCQ